ncbi:unnamed protein product [Pieris brassicae]|uniref:EF-hand domain-containing protein n=1 Tax=Pieris brassicae TaxID=7116 RepID=A0A9P0TGC5_PIEBR|nr:unnamed protein product [Pieris brassicae]
MEEESVYEKYNEFTSYPICKCYLEPGTPSEHELISVRKEYMLSTVSRTEKYLRERRIPEIIRFLLTKLISHAPKKPVVFLEKLIDDCMLFRSGHGSAPVLYEARHLEAVIKSFDPCNRGWLSAGQIRRLYTTLGLQFSEVLEERTSCDEVLDKLKICQEEEIYDLLSAGAAPDISSDYFKSDQSSNI